MNIATRTALERLAPVAIGLVAGIAGFLIAPDHVTEEFFSATAQVVPVLLLALAIEARLFGSVPRARSDDRAARLVERVHVALGVATVLILLAAELQSLAGLRDKAGGDPWIVCAGVAWGLAVIGAIAIRGTGRARVTPTMEIASVTKEGDVVVRIAISNEFGDREVHPLMNVLFGPGVEAYDWEPYTQTAGQRFVLSYAAPVTVDGKTIECLFSGGDRLALSPGDVAVSFTLLKTENPETLIVLRLDHVEFKGGRVEAGAFLHEGPSLEHIDGPTG